MLIIQLDKQKQKADLSQIPFLVQIISQRARGLIVRGSSTGSNEVTRLSFERSKSNRLFTLFPATSSNNGEISMTYSPADQGRCGVNTHAVSLVICACPATTSDELLIVMYLRPSEWSMGPSKK